MEKLSNQETGDHKNASTSNSCRTDEIPRSSSSQRLYPTPTPLQNKPLIISNNSELKVLAFASNQETAGDHKKTNNASTSKPLNVEPRIHSRSSTSQRRYPTPTPLQNKPLMISNNSDLKVLAFASNQETGDHKNTKNASTRKPFNVEPRSSTTSQRSATPTPQQNKPRLIISNNSELKVVAFANSIRQRCPDLVRGKRKSVKEEFRQDPRTRMLQLLKLKEKERFEQGLECCKFVLCFLDLAERSERNQVTAKIGAMGNYSPQDEEEEKRLGVSTKLELYPNPFKIKKVLTKSDTGSLCRLLLSDKIMRDDVFPTWKPEDQAEVTNQEAGKRVTIWDQDTRSEYTLLLKRWKNWKSFIMIDNWKRDFINRRALKERDEIGLYWDPFNNRFTFSLLQQAPPRQPQLEQI